MNLFKANENGKEGLRLSVKSALDSIVFNELGLIPAVAQQYDTKEVLMLAWMNRAALEETLTSGRVCYWSRSRQALWRKGESSGQVQRLKTLRLDCDGDTVLLEVDQTGPACHTGRRSCFFYQLEGDDFTINGKVILDPKDMYKN